MEGERLRHRGRVARRLTVGVALAALLGLGMTAAAIDGLNRLRSDAAAAAAGPVATLSPAMRMLQAADNLGTAALRLLEADGQSARLAARAAAERRQAAIADYLTHFPDAAGGPSGQQIAAGLTRLGETILTADRLAGQRLEALAGLPAARERLVVLIASLSSTLTERRQSLMALQRFHPDTMTELDRHEEWGRLSKNLLGALLLTTHDGDGQSGAAGAAAAHLTRLEQIAAGLPDSDFALMVRQRQEEISQAVTGPEGALTRLAALRNADEAAARLAIDSQRQGMELTQAATDHLDALRNDIDRRLFDLTAGSATRELQVSALALIGLLATAGAVMYVRRLGRRLDRLRRDLAAGAQAHVHADGGDDIALVALSAAAMIGDVQRQAAELEESRIRFDLAVEASDAAIWDENLAEGLAWWSPGYYRLLGYTPDEIRPQPGAWEMLVHPDDRAAAAEAAERCLAGVTESYTATYRVRRKDGSWIWVEDYGRIRRDPDGLPVRFVGLMLDISRRRSAEIRLRQAKEKAEAAARSGQAVLAAAEKRLRPGLRRLTGKLTQLEGWALTDEQRRQITEIKSESQQVLDALTELTPAAGADAHCPPVGTAGAAAPAADPAAANDDRERERDEDSIADADRAAIRRVADLDQVRLSEAFGGPIFPRNALNYLNANISPLLDRMARELALGDQQQAQAAARDAEATARAMGALALAEACRRFGAAMAVNRRQVASDMLDAAHAARERATLLLDPNESSV